MDAVQGEVSAAARAVLLRRMGRFVMDAVPSSKQHAEAARAVSLQLSGLGYVLAPEAEAAVARLPMSRISALQAELFETLAAALGANRRHRPLFRSFPDDIPEDTTALWWQRVLCHYLQAEDQDCLFCESRGTTQVLSPCRHVVCDRCFDGASYAACPICRRHVDEDSPFFKPTMERPRPEKRRASREPVRFKVLRTASDGEALIAELVSRLCRRTAALSKVDRADLETLVAGGGAAALDGIPAEIPVKETRAIVVATVLRQRGLEFARPLMDALLETATDVLRFVAVFSGADASLQGERRLVRVSREVPAGRWWGAVLTMLNLGRQGPGRQEVFLPIVNRRFKVAKLSRALRRALLARLESFAESNLTEDLLRHRSYWVWLGEFLHPHEYARRFPKVARAFKVVRRKDPEGVRAPRFETFAARIEAAIAERDVPALLRALATRPGELARRLDHLLRLAGEDAGLRRAVVDAFAGVIGEVALPVLLTLRGHLPLRSKPMARRIYWPKGGVTSGWSAPDKRPTLHAADIAALVAALDAELIARFALRGAVARVVIDEALGSIIAPFNERTASESAITLPRGSTVPIRAGKTLRLFLHWCQPEGDQGATDLDLSVGFYSAGWDPLGVCSYFELTCRGGDGATLAKSSGDLTDAPWPSGASEFVDLDLAAARRNGVRYAVMVVNSYAGRPFSALDRAFAGLMARDDVAGRHFDPRTVELKFQLAGERGISVPLVLDLETEQLHWLDVYSKGEPAWNNVETSKQAITTICPHHIAWFATGVRLSMLDLALLHAAARADRVLLRGEDVQVFERGPSESRVDFLQRLRKREGGQAGASLDGEGPGLWLLFRGDLEPAEGSTCYVLFPDKVSSDLAPADLLA